MRRSLANTLNTFFTLTLLLFPLSGDAVLPAVAFLGQQLVHSVIIDELKAHLIGSLASMGCKGSHIAGLIASADAAHGASGGMPGGMPGGAQIPGGMSPPMNNVPGGSTAGMGAAMGSMGGGAGILDAPPGTVPNGAGAVDPEKMAQVMAMAQRQMGVNAPMQPAMTQEQMAQMQQTMAAMQNAMAHPLSREETLGVFDELGDLGLLTTDMKSEARDCIMLAPPGSDAQIGAAGVMLKTIVLPSLREARARLADLTPEEQDQLAQGMVDALRKASPTDRKAFFDGMGAGFFPGPVVEKVRAAMAGQ